MTVVYDELTGTAENLAAVRDHFNFSYVQGSVADKTLVRGLVSDVDEVYHLAAAVGVQLISTAPIHTIETNIYPTELILSELAAPQARRLCRQAVSGQLERSVRQEPEANVERGRRSGVRSHDTCSLVVRGVESDRRVLVLAHRRQHRLPIVIGRFFNVIGPRQTGRYGMVLPRFVEAVLAGRPLVVHDDGSQVRCFAHVSRRGALGARTDGD